MVFTKTRKSVPDFGEFKKLDVSRTLFDIKTKSTMTRGNNLAIANTHRERICMKSIE
jgi:hypothetical protein